MIKSLAVFTSGGDAPGMNAAVRAVVRASRFYNIGCTGVYRGYQGLIEGDFMTFDSRKVAHILQRGGTILKSSRSQDFFSHEGRKRAYQHLVDNKIDALVAIGGNGTFTGARVFNNEFDFPIIGLPGTIDNDLWGTDNTIGFDTALNTVIEAVDKIRDTATSHNRLFLVEVMGRDSGFIALKSGIASGAVAVLLPEENQSFEDLVHALDDSSSKGRKSSIVIVAEGDEMGGAMGIVGQLKKTRPQYDTRVTILGHLQRGGAPTVVDRVLASRLGVAAVEGLLEGKSGVMAGIINQDVVYTTFDDCLDNKSVPSKEELRIAKILRA